MTVASKNCVDTCPVTLTIVRVLEADLFMTRALARCLECGACYLLELLDVSGSRRLYRASVVPDNLTEATVRSLGNGSCDINRANNEIATLSSQTTRLRELLVMEDGAFTAWANAHQKLPGTPWRQLPLDGSWFTTCKIERSLG